MRPAFLRAASSLGVAAALVSACGLDVVGTFTGADGGPSSTTNLPEAGAPLGDAGCTGPDCPCVTDCEAEPVTLTVDVVGSTTASVVRGKGAPIECPASCAATIPSGTTVELTAQPGADESLVGWSVPSCGRDLTCTVVVNASMKVTATFAPLRHYAHSTTELFRVEPTTGATTPIATFTGCAGNVYDLAIDRTGKAMLVTNASLYEVDLATATCGPTIGAIGGVCSSLVFMPNPASPADDVLLAGCGDRLYRVDRTNAARTEIGQLGGGFAYSGDLAWVPGRGLYAAVVMGASKDAVVRVDPTTGAMIGLPTTTGQDDLWGLGWYDGKLLAYGMSKVFTFDDATGTTAELGATTFIAYGGATGP